MKGALTACWRYYRPARLEVPAFRTHKYMAQNARIAMQTPTTWRACTSANAAEMMDVGAKTPE
jgi:hypothetical protein